MPYNGKTLFTVSWIHSYFRETELHFDLCEHPMQIGQVAIYFDLNAIRTNGMALKHVLSLAEDRLQRLSNVYLADVPTSNKRIRDPRLWFSLLRLLDMTYAKRTSRERLSLFETVSEHATPVEINERLRGKLDKAAALTAERYRDILTWDLEQFRALSREFRDRWKESCEAYGRSPY